MVRIDLFSPKQTKKNEHRPVPKPLIGEAYRVVDCEHEVVCANHHFIRGVIASGKEISRV